MKLAMCLKRTSTAIETRLKIKESRSGLFDISYIYRAGGSTQTIRSR
jgi:hypothetical protein